MSKHLPLPSAFHHLPVPTLQRGAEHIEPNRYHGDPRMLIARQLGKLGYHAGERRPDALHCSFCAYASIGWKQEERDFVTAVSAFRQARRAGR